MMALDAKMSNKSSYVNRSSSRTPANIAKTEGEMVGDGRYVYIVPSQLGQCSNGNFKM